MSEEGEDITTVQWEQIGGMDLPSFGFMQTRLSDKYPWDTIRKGDMSETMKIEKNDPGIRPSGNPDECLYCHFKVGEMHGSECVIVLKMVEYDVLVGNWDGAEATGVKVGTFTRADPYSWSDYDCEFHKNDSSWCADNAVDEIKWLDDELSQQARQKVESCGPGGMAGSQCACDLLVFKYVREFDGPFLSKD